VLFVELRVSLALAAIRTANARLATRTVAAKPGDCGAVMVGYSWLTLRVAAINRRVEPSTNDGIVASTSRLRCPGTPRRASQTRSTPNGLSCHRGHSRLHPVIAVSRGDDHRTLVDRGLLFGRTLIGCRTARCVAHRTNRRNSSSYNPASPRANQLSPASESSGVPVRLPVSRGCIPGGVNIGRQQRLQGGKPAIFARQCGRRGPPLLPRIGNPLITIL
jgi:hypothetical protein